MDNILDSHVVAYQGNSLYDFDNNIQMNWYPRRILELSGDSKSLLELGLGHGITTEIFAKHFKRHLVLDASSAVIGHFHEKFPNCSAEIAETYFEDFKTEEKFDLVIFGFILEHVDNPFDILAYYRQFLTPDARVFITVPNAEVLNRRLGHLAGMLPDMQLLSEHDLMCGHKRYFTVDSLSKGIQSAGYELVRMEGIYLKPFTTKQMMSLNFDQKVIEALCQVGISYPELCCGLLAEVK